MAGEGHVGGCGKGGERGERARREVEGHGIKKKNSIAENLPHSTESSRRGRGRARREQGRGA